MIFTMRSIWKNDEGAAIITVMLILLTLVIITPVLFYVVGSEARLSANHADMSQAYFVARSGAEAASDYVVKNFDLAEAEDDLREDEEFVEFINNAPRDLNFESETGSLEEIEYEIRENSVIITANGEFNEIPDTAKIEVRKPRTLFDYSIYNFSAEEALSLDRVLVDALIGSNHEVEWSPSVDPPEDYEEFVGLTEDDIFVVDKDKFDFDGPDPLPDPPVINEEGYYEAFDESIDIEVDGDMHVKTTGVNLTGNDQITVSGDGILHLKVENEFRVGGNAGFTVEGNAGTIVYLEEDIENSTFHGTAEGDLFIYAPYTDFDWQGTASVYGGIICNNFNVSGGGDGEGFTFNPHLLMQGAFENLEEILDQANTFHRHLWLK